MYQALNRAWERGQGTRLLVYIIYIYIYIYINPHSLNMYILVCTFASTVLIITTVSYTLTKLELPLEDSSVITFIRDEFGRKPSFFFHSI